MLEDWFKCDFTCNEDAKYTEQGVTEAASAGAETVLHAQCLGWATV